MFSVVRTSSLIDKATIVSSSHIPSIAIGESGRSFQILTLSDNRWQPTEPTTTSDILLQLYHALLITGRIMRRAFQLPREVFIRIVWHKALLQHSKTLSVLRDLLPVALHVLEVLGEVCVGPLEDLMVDNRVHLRFHVDVVFEGLRRRGKDIVGSLLDGAKEFLDFLWVGGEEAVVCCRGGLEMVECEMGTGVEKLPIYKIEQKQQQPNSASSSILSICTSSRGRPFPASHSSNSTICTFSNPIPASMVPSMMALLTFIPQRTAVYSSGVIP